MVRIKSRRFAAVLLSMFLIMGIPSGCGIGPEQPDPEPADAIEPEPAPDPNDMLQAIDGETIQLECLVAGDPYEGLSSGLWSDGVLYLPVDDVVGLVGEGFIRWESGILVIRNKSADAAAFGRHAGASYVQAGWLSGFLALDVDLSDEGLPVGLDIDVAMPDRFFIDGDVYYNSDYCIDSGEMPSDPVSITHDGRFIWADEVNPERVWIASDDGQAYVYSRSHIYSAQSRPASLTANPC